jgi:hypothetical protein
VGSGGLEGLAENPVSQSIQADELIVRHFGSLTSYGLMTVVVRSSAKAASDPALERVVSHAQRALPAEAAGTTVVRPHRESSGVNARR